MINSFFFLKDLYVTLISEFFRSTRLFIRVVRLILPAREARTVTSLSSTLGQYGVNSNEFIVEFDKKTEYFEPGFCIRLNLLLLADRKFYMDFKKISTFELFMNFSTLTAKENYVLNRLNFYKIFLIKSDFSCFSEVSLLMTLLGTLRSFKKFRLIK